MIRFIEIDIEVDPLSLRRQFQFLVAQDHLEVRAGKRFGDIPVPKLVGFGRRIWIGLEMQFFIRTGEKNVEIPRRPARPDFGSISGLLPAVGVCIHGDDF